MRSFSDRFFMASPRGTVKLSKVERSYSVKTRVGLVIAAIMLLQVILVVPASEAQDTSQTALRVNGAAMAANDVELWTKSFIELDPDVNVVGGGGITSYGEG